MRCGPSFLARYIIVSQQEGLAYRVLRLLLRFDLLDDDLETIAGRWEKVSDVLGSAVVEFVELLWSSSHRLDSGPVRVGVH